MEDNEELTIGCDPELPNLSVGDFSLYSIGPEFEDFKILNKGKQNCKFGFICDNFWVNYVQIAFILAISDSTCDNCCKGEVMLHEIMTMFKAGDITYKGRHFKNPGLNLISRQEYSNSQSRYK